MVLEHKNIIDKIEFQEEGSGKRASPAVLLKLNSFEVRYMTSISS